MDGTSVIMTQTTFQVPTQQVLQALRKQQLLASLSDEDIQALLPAMRFHQFEKSQIVVAHGSEGESLHMVLGGRLQVLNVTADGREVGLNFLQPGEFFGELSVIDSLPRSASVVAVATSVVAMLPREAARTLMFRHPGVAQTIMQHLCAMVRDASQQRSILGISKAHTRIYAVLHHTATLQPGQLMTIEELPNQQALAIMANVSRETVSRALQLLKHAQVLEKDNRRLIVRRPDMLEALANGSLQPEEISPSSSPEPSSQPAPIIAQ